MHTGPALGYSVTGGRVGRRSRASEPHRGGRPPEPTMGRGLARALHTLDENCPAPSVRWEAVNPRANRVRLVPDSPTTGWPVFLYWARKFYESPQFEEAERNYKFRAVRPLKLARKGLLFGE